MITSSATTKMAVSATCSTTWAAKLRPLPSSGGMVAQQYTLAAMTIKLHQKPGATNKFTTTEPMQLNSVKNSSTRRIRSYRSARRDKSG